MKYKICGLKHASNIEDILKYKPDFVGFIFHEPSTRNISREEMTSVNQLDFGATKKIAVVVNKSTQYILDLASEFDFKYIQLHGDESIPQINQLKEQGLKIIKTFSIENELPENLMEYDKVCDYLLFDTKGKARGGNGVHFNWDILLSKDFTSPYFLSGGLSYEDIDEIKKLKKQPVALDFNSRLEIMAGFKNKNKVKQLKDEIDRY